MIGLIDEQPVLEKIIERNNTVMQKCTLFHSQNRHQFIPGEA
jgi:hypothetical protein